MPDAHPDAQPMIFPQLLKNLPHRTITNLVRVFASFISKGGVCTGFTSMWFQAVLSGPEELARFYARLDDIAVHYATKEQAKALKRKIDEIFIKKSREVIKTDFSEDEKQKIEIRAFAEAVSLQQRPKMVSDRYISQNDKKTSYALTASQKMEDQKIEIFGSLIGILVPTREELMAYFINMEAKLNVLEMDTPMGFLLGSSGHTVGVYFNQERKKWHYLDINFLSGKITYDEVASPARLAELIFTSLEDRGKYIAFSIMTISTVFSPELIEALRGITNASFIFEDRKDDHGVTALWLACSEGDKEWVCRLLENGAVAHINFPDETGATPLFIACQNGHIEIVALLLEHGASKSINLPDKDGVTPLLKACQNGHTEIVTLLLEHDASKSINLPDKDGVTPLWVACEKGHTEIVALLLEHGASKSINLPDKDGVTSLWKACQNGHTEIVRLLLEHGASKSIYLPDKDGVAPFWLACQNGHTEIVRLLLERNAREGINLSEKDGATPLFMACQNGHTKIVALLLQNGAEASINTPREDRVTPLWKACQKGYTEIVALLLKHGASKSINLSEEDGVTPIFIACEEGHKEVVALLLQQGASESINLPDKDGVTPLWVACYNGQVDVVRLLLENGAKIDTPNHKGRTPLSVALKGNHIEIVRLLNEYSAKNQVAAVDQKEKNNPVVSFSAKQKRKAPEHPELHQEKAPKIQKTFG